MAAESSRSSSAADSYVGSLISLTSKSEIRYEGILYNINTEESSIGLRNVRSFGTEGRKKDGPQVMPSDKVYEYILFRGSDIKDLQVKSSPPAQQAIQTAPAINSDPAIIQSHYPRPPATTSSMLPAGAGSLTDIGSHPAQLGQPGSTFQGGIPLYQPGGNLGSWGPSPPLPSANGSGLAMPMYWPGYYSPQNGLPQLHQQSLLRPPPGLSMPPPMQQPMQYPAYNASLPAGASNLPEYPLLPTTTTSLNLTSTSLPSSLPPVPPVTVSSEALPSFMQNKASNSTIPSTSMNASLPSLPLLTTSSPDVNGIVPPISNKPIASPVLPHQTISQSTSPAVISNKPLASPVLPYQVVSQSTSPAVVISSSIHPEQVTPSLVTPGQLLHSGQSAVSSSQTLETAQKDVEVVQVSPRASSEMPVPVATEAQPPILPLPTPSYSVQKPNGVHYQARHNNYRGRERGRGTGIYRPVTKFTEEFDFTAMNEKFNKDEVWGHLGKSNKTNLKEKEGYGNASEEDQYEYEDEAELPKLEVKPVYSKDDFFDSLSCNALDHQSNNGRTRFSEQMKLDTETFGEFSRYRGGRGGRGGRFRGGYYGRGYGYSSGGYSGGRGRGQSMPSRDY